MYIYIYIIWFYVIVSSVMPMGVSVVYNQRDQATGEAFVEFSNEVDLQR